MIRSDPLPAEFHPVVQAALDQSESRQSAGVYLWGELASDRLPPAALPDALPLLTDAKSSASDERVVRLCQQLFEHAWNRSTRSYLEEIVRDRGIENLEDPELLGFLELCRTSPRHDRYDEEITRTLTSAFANREDSDLLEMARKRLPTSVFSRLCARAAASSTSRIETAAQLRVALRSALADETVRIVLRIENPELYDQAWSALDDRRREMCLVLLGNPRSLVERIFGPTPREFFFGATGLVGFAGIAALVFTSFFFWLTAAEVAWSALLFVLLFLGIRPLLVRSVAPRFTERALLAKAIRPSSAGLLLSWSCRQRLEAGLAPKTGQVEALRETLEGAPQNLLERAKVVSSVIERDIIHTAPRAERLRLEQAVDDLRTRLDREKRMLAGVSHKDPALVASALRQQDSYEAALRALPRAAQDSGLLDAVLESLENRDDTELWHYALKGQIGDQVRQEEPDKRRVQSWDNALATIAGVAELRGGSLGVRLVWASGDQVSVAAQRAFLELARRESRTTHSVELFDLAAKMTPESKSRTLASLEVDQGERYLIALLGDDSTLFRLMESDHEDRPLLLRRNAGPAAALGLWWVTNASPSASERRQSWRAIEELAERYGYGIFELIDESVARVGRLETSEWQMLARRRLEEAMVGRRRWTASAWRRAVGRPEILEHAQGLVWASFDLYDRIIGTFRIDESLELVDLNDRPWILQGHQHIGLPAASDLDENLSREWSDLFADYEILAPFDQLNRHAGAVEEVPARSFEKLQSRGWLTTHPDEGRIFSFLRPFLELGVTALIEVDPGIGEDEDELQRVVHLGFIDGIQFEEPAVPVRADEESDPNAFRAARELLEEDMARAALEGSANNGKNA